MWSERALTIHQPTSPSANRPMAFARRARTPQGPPLTQADAAGGVPAVHFLGVPLGDEQAAAAARAAELGRVVARGAGCGERATGEGVESAADEPNNSQRIRAICARRTIGKVKAGGAAGGGQGAEAESQGLIQAHARAAANDDAGAGVGAGVRWRRRARVGTASPRCSDCGKRGSQAAVDGPTGIGNGSSHNNPVFGHNPLLT